MFAQSVGFSEDEAYPIDMAVREAVANAVKHGNNLDETKQVEIALSSSDTDFEITVRDFGTGFAVEEIPDPTNPENLLKAFGRGILFMRTFMDEVEWFNHPRRRNGYKNDEKALNILYYLDFSDRFSLKFAIKTF